VVPDQTDQLAESLVPSGRIGYHRRVNAAGTAFPDDSKPVHEEVVSDVWPSLLGACVVAVEAGEDTGDLGGLVSVGRCRVMNQQNPYVSIVLMRHDRDLAQAAGPTGSGPQIKPNRIGSHRQSGFVEGSHLLQLPSLWMMTL